LFPVQKPIHRSEKLERSIAAKSSKKRSITAKSSKELRSHSNSFAPDSVVASWVSDTRQNSKQLTAPSTGKKIQNAQETGKHETHQAAVFVVHQTNRRGAICFLVYIAMADFFFLALTLSRSFKCCAGRATTGTRKYNPNLKP
jgi:hypothetical protein